MRVVEAHDRQLVRRREARPGVQPPRERLGQRHRGDDRDGAVAGADERDVGLGGERRDRADRTPARHLHPQRGRRREQPGDRGAVAAGDRGLELRVAAEALGGAARPLPLVLERHERGAEAGLEAVVRAARDAALRHLAEAPEGSRERQHRERQKRADQLEFEAPQHLALQFPASAADNPLRSLFGTRGEDHEADVVRALTCALAITGVAGAISLPTLTLGEATTPPHASFAIPAPADDVVIEADRRPEPPTPTRPPRAWPPRAPKATPHGRRSARAQQRPGSIAPAGRARAEARGPPQAGPGATPAPAPRPAPAPAPAAPTPAPATPTPAPAPRRHRRPTPCAAPAAGASGRANRRVRRSGRRAAATTTARRRSGSVTSTRTRARATARARATSGGRS